MAGKFVVKTASNGEAYFRLQARSHPLNTDLG